jgi:hypothetical protein
MPDPSDATNVVSFQPSPTPEEESARRLKIEVERLSRLSHSEWTYYLSLPGYAEKYGIDAETFTKLVKAETSKAEKKQREEKAADQRREQRAEKQRVAADRKEERRRREQQRAQKEADREREKALAGIAKLPCTVHEQQLAALAKGSGEDLDFLREEFSKLIAAEDSGTITSVDSGPWPEPVDLNTLLMETTAQIQRYVVIHDEAAVVAVVLWIAFAWIHDIAIHSPILRIVAGDSDAGKTTLCGVLGLLTPRAATTAELTGPSLFRFVDQVKPTLIIDNADKLLRKKPDLATIIEASWTRGTPIPRVVDGHVYLFNVFCPKVLAGIALALDPATLTRCIDIRMWPKLPDEKVEEFKYADDDTFVTLRRKWARWAADNVVALRDANPAMADFNNRIKMNWKLQFAIADLAGGAWSKKVRVAAAKLARGRREPSKGKRALAKLWDAAAVLGPLVTSKQLEALFRADDEWGDAITKWQIADLFNPFGFGPDMIHPRGRPGDRGYDVRWDIIEKVFRHYLGKSLPPNCTPVRKLHEKPRK